MIDRDPAGFQATFMAALFDTRHSDTRHSAALAAQPGFQVYRNTLMAGCVDALRGNFPTVLQMVGDEWFDAAAQVYVPEHLPDEPALARYGRGFSTFLATFEPARDMTWLPAVAGADRLAIEALFAADEPCLEPAAVARLSAPQLAARALRPHAAARWAWFAAAPAASLWCAHRQARAQARAPDLAEIEWAPQGLLLTRPGAAVEGVVIGRGGIAFMDACQRGDRLSEVVVAALNAQADLDLAGLMQLTLQAGAFAALGHGLTRE